ncbi:S-layer homology domain-containing protein, partial [Mitsuokella jalaludinii]|uniref:S-layer homology domain-containing protein n=1 Tax=Mitsuokella jalaludinii TaxID=187979 RepID=UPI003F895088
QKDASVSSNLNTLDTQVKANADAVSKEKQDREAAITNITNNIGDLSDSAVKYDADTNKTKITLAGEGGTTITNLKDGALSDSSTDAVTGKQLYAEQQARDAADTAINNKLGTLDANGNYIQKDASVSSNLNTLDTQVKANADAVSKEKQDREAAITNITNNIGDLSDSAVKYDADTNKTKITLAGEGGTTITNLKDGALSDSSTDAVTGKQLYAEQQARDAADTAINNKLGTLDANGNYIQKDASVSSNLNTLDTQVKANADAVSKEKQDREAAITNVTNNLNSLTDSAVQYDKDSNKGTVTLAGADGTTIKNLKAGEVAETSKDAVNGSQLYAEQQARDAADTAINNKLGTLDANGNYIQKDASVSSNLNTLDTQVKANADAVSKEKQDREAAITNVTNNLNSLTDSAVQYDKDSNKGTVTLAGADGTTIKNLKAGEVAETSKDAVNGSQLYAEQQARDAADTAINNKLGTLDANGNYIQKDASVSSNLNTLDTQVKANADAVSKEKQDREAAITNITNNIGDLSDSAVKYDADTNKTKITLAGEGGTTITNLKDGALSDSSTDAVTGKQLYAEQQARTQAVADLNSGLQNLRDNVVLYDSSAKDVVTFAGSKGTRLTNLKDARLTATSTDAVTGRQLYATNQNISGFAADIKMNTDTISDLSKSVSNSLDSVSAMSESFTALDNAKADASLNNLSAAGKQVITTAAQEAVQEYMKSLKAVGTDTTSGTQATTVSTSKVAAPAKAGYMTVNTADLLKSSLVVTKADTGSLLTSLAEVPAATNSTPNYVAYDEGDSQTISLEDTTGEGVKLTNVKAGELAAASKDAVNGSQLYETNRDIKALDKTLSKLNTVAAQAQTDITRIKTQNLNFGSDINTLKEQVNTGFNATVDGAKVKTINPSSNYLNFTAGDNAEVKALDNGSIEISAKGTGKVESGSKGLVTGDAVYQAIKDIPTSTSLAGKADTDLGNLTDAGKQVIHDAVKADLDQKANKDASNIDVDAFTKKLGTGKNEAGSTGLVTGDTLHQAVSAVSQDVANKADKDLSNLTDAGKQVIRDTMQGDLDQKANKDASNIDTAAFAEKLGTGKDAAGDKNLVTGDTLHQSISAVSQDVANKADKDLGNLTDAGKQVITTAAQNAVRVIGGTNTTVTEGKADDGAKTYAVNVDNQSIRDAVKDDLDKKADKTQVEADLAKKANTDASNIDVDAFTKKLGTGTVAENSNSLVTGSAVYQAIKDMPTGESLVKRDGDKITIDKEGEATTVDVSGKDGMARTITGVATDTHDATSAANVGYVNDTVDQAVGEMGSRLTKDINRVGAGAAALAALHPGDFDPDNKLEFSAGFGHYKGSNAAAVAAYYHPNEDTLFNIGTTLGNGSPMVSAGVTVKFGPGGGKNTLSRTALTKQVAADQDKIQALTDELGAMKAQMAKMASLMDMLNLDTSKKTSFKDVPDGHWAKEAVDTLAGNGVVEGFGDGEFKGNQNMTRYEYAEMLYKALINGQKVDQKVLNEYAPELQKIHASHNR